MNTLVGVPKRKVIKQFFKLLHSSSGSTSSNPDIVIPNRIERGPTDILKVLEKTLSNDWTAAHYKYHDDPFLIPKSKQEQRKFALAKESGKKTAMWIHKEHADLFQHKVADPMIPAFVPPVICTEKSQASEELLVNAISNAEVSEALNIYKLLDENVSVKTKQSLLELLCYSNSNNLQNEEFVEEKWFQRGAERIKNTWLNSPDIEKLFKFLTSQDKETTAAAYCALICGTAKYLEVTKTWSLYETCINQNIPLSVEGYNAVISIIPYVIKGEDKPKRTLLTIFETMAANGVKPNVRTLNAAIKTLTSIPNYEKFMDLATTLFAEFKELGIKPSLAFYYYLFIAISEIATVTSEMIEHHLVEVLNVLEKETLTLQDPKDTYFFSSVMYLAEQTCARDIGEKIHKLLLRDDNYQFLSDSYKESIYYRNYVNLCMATWSIEDFLQMYYRIVPNIYIPEPSIMRSILETLKIHSVELITENMPKLWCQIKNFDMYDRDNVIELALELMTTRCLLLPSSPMHKQFGEYALDLWEHKQNQIARKFQRNPWKATVYGYIAILLVRAGIYDQAFNIVDLLTSQHGHVTGILILEQLDELFKTSILQGHTPLAFILTEYAINSGFDCAATMARQINKSLPLSEYEKNRLENLVGANVLELTKESEDRIEK